MNLKKQATSSVYMWNTGIGTLLLCNDSTPESKARTKQYTNSKWTEEIDLTPDHGAITRIHWTPDTQQTRWTRSLPRDVTVPCPGLRSGTGRQWKLWGWRWGMVDHQRQRLWISLPLECRLHRSRMRALKNDNMFTNSWSNKDWWKHWLICEIIIWKLIIF